MKALSRLGTIYSRLKNLVPRSFYARMSLMVCGVIVIIGCTQYILQYHYWKNALYAARQQILWGMAETVAHKLRPVLEHGFEDASVYERLSELRVEHPDVEIHLLDKEGYVLQVDFGRMNPTPHPLKRIPLSLLDEFLTPRPSRKLPLLGPAFVPGRESIFSAAKIRIGEEPGYVYIDLIGANFLATRAGVVDRMLIFGGLVATVILVLGTAVLAVFVVLLLTRRLRALSTVVQRFSQGDTEARVEVRGNDELAELGTTFNEMADRIVGSMDALAEADRKRREMVAHVSHDLSRPIAAIQGYLETVVEDDMELSPAQQVGYLEIALRNTRSLKELVNDFFELAKLEARDILPEKEAFSLLETVTEEVLPRLYALAREKRVTLRAEHPERICASYADVAMIERVISNLVENAIRYNKEGGEVVVRLEEEEQGTTVEIRDTGPGIAEEEQDRIFDRFYRGSIGRERDARGTGLGLAIVKEILGAHGESIDVESAPGQGTLFRFSLPSAAPS